MTNKYFVETQDKSITEIMTSEDFIYNQDKYYQLYNRVEAGNNTQLEDFGIYELQTDYNLEEIKDFIQFEYIDNKLIDLQLVGHITELDINRQGW